MEIICVQTLPKTIAINANVGGSLVTATWRVIGLRMEETDFRCGMRRGSCKYIE